MKIDLTRFSKQDIKIVPIVGGWGQRDQRKVYAPNAEDGWYRVVFGDTITLEGKATPLEILKDLRPLKKYLIYAMGTEGIPLNFDNFRRIGVGEAVNINFLALPIFTVASVVRWEDERFYFYEQVLPKERRIIQGAKEAFESNGNLLELSGATPELRYYFLLGQLQRESFRALEDLERFALTASERSNRIAAFQTSFPNRLKLAISNAGGVYKKHTKRGNGFTVEWELGGQLVKTNIRDDFSVTSAGYCLSGDDRKHTLGSLIQLAKMFQERSPLYITRE